ncbi:hypothetical protein AWRI1631_40400 [Saccharomyces cerevisiae AWRI1631]|nr:hypothetical protein AWRI1631_40400 [Saccharomyces cerevisiae AWRI1631]
MAFNSNFLVSSLYLDSTPIGTEQPPSKVLIKARSERQHIVAFRSQISSRIFIILVSPFLISIPRAPCPTAWYIVSEWNRCVILFSNPIRINPADAKMMHWYGDFGSSSFCNLVCIFPLTLSNFKCGYFLFS